MRILLTNGSGTIAQSIHSIVRHRLSGQHNYVAALCESKSEPTKFIYDELVVPEIPYAIVDDPDWHAWLRHSPSFDLIIPTTDVEAVTLAAANVKGALVHTEEYHRIGFDKSLLGSSAPGRIGNLRVLPTLPREDAMRLCSGIVAKPRFGGLSVGVDLRADPERNYGSNYVFQERIEGLEYTIGMYFCQNGRVELIAFFRKLKYGISFFFNRDTEFEDRHGSELIDFGRSIDARGFLNVQGILSKDGIFHIFEINTRISGLCGIRDAFGFREVEAAILETVFGQTPAPFRLLEGGGYKKIHEYVVPGPVKNIEELPLNGRAFEVK